MPAEQGGSVALSLRLEGATVLLAAVTAFHLLDGSWFWFAVLLLSPDLFMLGYLKGLRFGALCYNVAHTYVAPGILTALWFILPDVELLWIAAVWTAHIGMDRMFGYGLKYPTDFKDTHLQRA